MSYIKNNLSPKEKLIIQPKIHWFVLVNGPLVSAAGIMLLSMDWVAYTGTRIYNASTDSWWYWLTNYTFNDIKSFGANIIPLIAVLVGFYLTISGFVRKVSIDMGITSRRIMIKTGLLHTDTDELSFSDIESIDIHQSPFGKFLDFGDITFNSLFHHGAGARRKITFQWVTNPSKIRRIALAGRDAYAPEMPKSLLEI